MGPCDCFIDHFNNEAKVFLEHRTSTFFPAKPTLNNNDRSLQSFVTITYQVKIDSSRRAGDCMFRFLFANDSFFHSFPEQY